MTNKDYAHIAIIADRSGSMRGAADGDYSKAQRTTDGVRAFVREQQAFPGKTTFSMIDFDDEVTIVDSFGDGSKALEWECRPRNMTALLDAVGKTITETGLALEAMPEDERPGRVYIVIGTDGLENMSREYTLDMISKMVQEQQDHYGWEFVYIGTELEAFASGKGMGYSAHSTMPTAPGGTMDAYLVTASAVTTSRGSGQSVSYSAEQRQQVADAGKTARHHMDDGKKGTPKP